MRIGSHDTYRFGRVDGVCMSSGGVSRKREGVVSGKSINAAAAVERSESVPNCDA